MKQVRMSDLVGAMLKGVSIAPQTTTVCFHCKKRLALGEEFLWDSFPLCKGCDVKMNAILEKVLTNGDV